MPTPRQRSKSLVEQLESMTQNERSGFLRDIFRVEGADPNYKYLEKINEIIASQIAYDVSDYLERNEQYPFTAADTLDIYLGRYQEFAREWLRQYHEQFLSALQVGGQEE